MDQVEQSVQKPSVFVHGLLGCLTANALGIPAVILLSVIGGDYKEQATFKLFVSTGALGAIIGFEIAARRLKAFGGGGSAKEWKQFWGTLPFYGLAGTVLGLSAVLSEL